MKQQSGVISRTELERYLSTITEEVGPTMIPRRLHTVISWLEHTELIIQQYNQLMLVADLENKIGSLGHKYLDDPLFPSIMSLHEYHTLKQRIAEAKKLLSLMIKEAEQERANSAHSVLVEFIAQRIRRAGLIPQFNQLIDLAAEIEGQAYIFEMKSMTDQNQRSQIRRGTSQLYEYRYLHTIPSARLVLVIENRLATTMRWVESYIESDRNIHLIWVANGEAYGSEHTRRELGLLY